MVTDYLSKLSGECRYNYSKLKNVVYLVSEDHLKDVQIDNGEAYISGLTELPLRINGFNIQLQESTSLDERYKFQKTLTLSMHGYVNYKIFGGRYYAIIESEDGTFWMINVDFPSRITHTFNLSKDVNQTDFTFASLSNFPTLKLNADFEAVSPVCLGLNVHGIDTLQLIEFEKARLDTENKTVISTEDFKTIEFLGNSASFQEVYDGTKVTDTITFDIAFDNYKPSWQYNLLEFLDNRYSAIITPKGGDNKYYPGYNFGLQPSYNIQTASNNDGSDIITVTLVETSSYGTTSAVDWSDEQSTATRWRYVKKVGDIVCYECVGIGQAKYLVQQEVDAFGNPTGNYMALDGYEGVYNSKLNIVDTFDDEEIFNTNDCSEDGQCPIVTDMPTTIYFTAITCSTYSVRSDCDWSINNIPDNLTISPLSGAASSSDTTVTVCQTAPVTQSAIENSFSINAGNNVRIVNVKTQLDSGCIRPTHQSINCLNQTVTFTYDGSCNLIVQSIPSNLTYTVSNNTLTVQVPKNETTSGKTYPIIVSNCDCSSASSVVYIEQDKTYERWANDTGFICESGNSYTVQRRYTGTTSDNITGRTDTVRAGSLIQSGDTACDSSSSKYIFDNHYYCVNGDKYQALEQVISYDSGQTWVKTNKTQLGEFVESASTFCQQEALYEWRLSDEWQCSGQTSYWLWQKWEQRGEQDWIPAYPNTWSINAEGSKSLSAKTVNDTSCGYIPPSEPIYRWVNLDPSIDWVCDEAPYHTLFGWLATYTGGTTLSAECNSSSAITFLDITKTDLVSVEIGNCIRIIDHDAFRNCSSLTSVTIPNTVLKIGGGAFEFCGSLTSVTIPNSVTIIDEYAFEGCSGLTYAIIDAIGSTGRGTFYNCSGLTAVTIGSGITIIDGGSFNGCSSLTSITIPNSVTSIGGSAFQHCSGLTSITIPNSVTSIGDEAFRDCSGLTEVTIGSGITSISSGTFSYCSNLSSVTIPDSVTSIGNSAFAYCKSLTSVTIPDSVTSMGQDTFYDCSGLTEVTCNAIIPPSLGPGSISTFYNTNNCPIYVPSGSVDTYKSAWSTYANRIFPIGYVPPTPPTPTIDGKFMAGYRGGTTYSAACDSATTLTTGVTKPSGYEYTAMTYAVIGDCITKISNSAFTSCYNLVTISIPSGITSIGSSAFRYCSGLTSIDIPSGVTSINSYTFYGCSGLTSINIPNSVTSIGSWAFYNCTILTSATIGSGARSIGSQAFGHCSGLTSVNMPNTLTTIDTGAFNDCVNLTSITIPDSVTSIGNQAFKDCRKITSIVIPSGITSISNGIFDNCYSLSSITIPDTITSIGNNSFRHCSGLPTMIIPSGVTSIGDEAFSYCYNLNSITCLATTPPTLGSSAFNNTNDCPIYVPAASVSAYKSAWTNYAYQIQAIPNS